ncbi:MAG: MFS transporter [Planctomycetes bacterium]|nr:MFS transporter [Planctomycetota bacterium]
MTANRAEALDRQFQEHVRALEARAPRDPALPVRPGSTLTGAALLDLFESQLICRLLDLAARELRARDQGYYTIGSAGHEGNVVVGRLARHTDPAFLHYRSGALMAERSRHVAGLDPVRDALLSLVASSDDPISGGRHKVWGSRPLWVPPQTSTIASHLPKAVGCAVGIDRARRLKLPCPVPGDSIAICSFGDASLNHSTAQGAFNAAGWMASQKLPVPVLFVCEDNGIGISVPTPDGWVEASMRQRPGIAYVQADGLDLVDAWEGAARAVETCRRERRPVLLHLRTVRLLAHAGSDIETEYHTLEEIEAAERRDPLLRSAALVVEAGLLAPAQVLERYEALRARIRAGAAEVVTRPKLRTARDVMATLAPLHPAEVDVEARRPAPLPAESRRAPQGRQRHLAAMINQGLQEALRKYPEALLFGEDVAKKGGVYHVTAGLWKEFGAGRVFNTLLDEQAILGLALGAAHVGLLPLPEIQYLAYVHNAEDQLRGEACSLQFFSSDQFRNPTVVRIASFAYQKGFGGHFHNDNSLAVLRDIPGMIVCAPARGDDAVRLLRTCLALAKVDGRVVSFCEPIALYMTKDLYEDGDGLWLSDFPAPGEAIAPGEGRVYHEDAPDLTIVSYANGLWRSLRAARTLEREHGLRARVVDLRWLQPLNLDLIEREARATGRLLVVDECRRAGGLGEAIVAGVALRAGDAVRAALLAAEDTYIPLGPAMQTVLPQEEHIVAAARDLVRAAPPAAVVAGVKG